MTQLNSAFTIVVKRQAGALARRSFGVGMLLHYHTKGLGRVLTITAPEDLTTLGFASTDPIWIPVNAVFGQAVRPKTLKIGRRANAPSQTLTITVGATLVEGDEIRFTVNDTEIEYTILAAATPTSVAAALVPLINAAAGGTPASSAIGVITIATAANGLIRFRSWTGHLSFKSTGADPGLAADLNAIYAEDKNFTAIELVHMNEAESKVAAQWAETNDVIFEPTFYDSEIADVLVTTDAASDLDALNYKNTASWWSGKDTSAHIGFALFCWLSAQTLPGGETQAHKQLSGILADDAESVNSGELIAIRDKSCNVYYQLYEDRAVTWEGITSEGRFIDSRRFLLWQAYDLELSLFDAVNSQPDKLPFDEDGRQALISAVKASLGRGVTQKGIDKDRPFVIEAPEMSTVTAANRAARVFPDITVRFFEAGAIHATSMTVLVSD